MSDAKTLDGVFTEKEAAVSLRISRISLWKLRKNNSISHRQIGRRILYLKTDLMEFLNGNKQGENKNAK